MINGSYLVHLERLSFVKEQDDLNKRILFGEESVLLTLLSSVAIDL